VYLTLPAEHVNWGDIPTWISSLAGLLALVFAAAAVIWTRRMFRIESDRDRVDAVERRAQRDFARRGQAALVSAWWGARESNGEWGAHVRNASEAPVYQAHLTVLNPDDPASAAKIELPVLPPSEAASFHPVVDHTVGDREFECRTTLTFTDAAGVRWQRDAYGRLVELAPNLTFWGDNRLGSVLSGFAADFLAAYGVTVAYRTEPFAGRRASILAASAEGEIGDVLDAPHDWIGTLVRKGVIEAVVMSANHRATFTPRALGALTFEGRLYGVPLFTHCAALIRNLDLAPKAPATFDELIEMGESLVARRRTDHIFTVEVGPGGDPFHLSAVFTSLGGSLFHQGADGSWDLSRVHIADDASIVALERIRTLGEAGSGALRTGIDARQATRLFLDRRTAFLIGTSDDISDARRAGIRCAVTPVPPFAGGAPPAPYLTVTGLFVTRAGRNNAIARDLVADYLARAGVINTMSRELLSVGASRLARTDDPALAGLESACSQAVPMPNHPQIADVWTWTGAAQAEVIRGGDPETAARRAADLFAARFDPSA
jgi:arabinogalactan oligomer / maltooligosaccharide transport system substrate-binding protein